MTTTRAATASSPARVGLSFSRPREIQACITYAIIPALSALTLGGCNAVNHEEAKISADKRWVEVRTDLKLQMAEKAFEELRFEDAALTAAETLTLDPARHEAFAIMIKSYLEMQDLERTEDAIATARAASADSPELTYLRGVYLEMRGKYEQALACFSDARSRAPRETDYLIGQVETLLQLDRAEVALRIINEHLAEYDDEDKIAPLAAVAAELAGESRIAIRWYQKSCMLMPSQAWLHTRLARLLIGEGRHDDAIHWLAPFLEEEPSGTPAGQADGKDATTGHRATIMALLADARLHAGKAAAAVETQQALAEMEPANAHRQLRLMEAAMRAGRPDIAVRTAVRASQHLPAHDEIGLMHASALRVMKRNDEAVTVLQSLLTHHPRDVDALCLLAEILAETGDDEQAVERFKQALELQANCRWARLGLQRLNAG